MNLHNHRFGHGIYLRPGKVLGTPIPPFRYFFPKVNFPSNLKPTIFPAKGDKCMIQMSVCVCDSTRLCTVTYQLENSTRGIRGLLQSRLGFAEDMGNLFMTGVSAG